MKDKVIGKLLYSGPSYKYGLTDGKMYECIGLSHGDVKIIDDENEAFFYSATKPYKDKNGKKGEWIVIEDLSDDLVTDFVKGEKNRTPEEEQFEKGKVPACLEIHFGSKNRHDFVKSVSKKATYVEETPEIKKHQEKLLESFARSLLPLIEKEMAKNGGKLPTSYEEEIAEGTEYDLTKGSNSYKIKYMEDRWDIYKVENVKKQQISNSICSLSTKEFPKLYQVKLHIARSDDF